jgi:ATP adenylyltransferase
VSAVVRRTTAKSRKATGRPAARVAKRPASRASGEVTTHGPARLWAPWRMSWLRRADAPQGCLFCRVGEANADRRDLVIARRPHAVLMLNKYPYASAHLMVAVKRHAAQFRDLSPAEREDLHELTAVAEHLLEVEYAPHGVNYGLNVGKVAGAGFPGHMHLHLVPRWNGDTNFMPAVAQTRVLPEALEVTWARLRRALATLEQGAGARRATRARTRRG